MFESFTEDASRRDVLKASAVGVGASMGLVGTASAADDVVEFDETITITPEDSGKTFVQTADFEGRVRIRPGTEDVTVDGNGYTISGGGVGGGSFDEETISNITLQNLHLPDGSINFTELNGLVVRNNLAQWFEVEWVSGVRAVDNTIAGLMQTFENTSGNVFARNVAAGLSIYDDPAGSHRVSNNFFTGGRSGPVVALEVLGPSDGEIEYRGNYVANGGGAGFELEGGLDLKLRENVVVGNGGPGLWTDGADVRENVFIGNEGDGVSASVGIFRNNVATSNDGVGFDVRIGRDCLRNAAISNGGDGFRVESDGAEVKFNCATGNDGDGVVLGGSGVPFRKNNVTGNGGDGLVVDADDSGITRNRICGNDGEQLVDDGDDNRFENNLVC